MLTCLSRSWEGTLLSSSPKGLRVQSVKTICNFQELINNLTHVFLSDFFHNKKVVSFSWRSTLSQDFFSKNILENNKKIATKTNLNISYLTWLLERCRRANKHAHHNETCFQRVISYNIFPFLGEIEKSTNFMFANDKPKCYKFWMVFHEK